MQSLRCSTRSLEQLVVLCMIAWFCALFLEQCSVGSGVTGCTVKDNFPTKLNIGCFLAQDWCARDTNSDKAQAAADLSLYWNLSIRMFAAFVPRHLCLVHYDHLPATDFPGWHSCRCPCSVCEYHQTASEVQLQSASLFWTSHPWQGCAGGCSCQFP